MKPNDPVWVGPPFCWAWHRLRSRFHRVTTSSPSPLTPHPHLPRSGAGKKHLCHPGISPPLRYPNFSGVPKWWVAMNFWCIYGFRWIYAFMDGWMDGWMDGFYHDLKTDPPESTGLMTSCWKLCNETHTETLPSSTRGRHHWQPLMNKMRRWLAV